MSPLPQHITYGFGGTITLDLPERPTNAVVRIVDRDGTQLLSAQSANISTINTTISGTPSAGDRAINVAANTGISAGSTFWITDDPEQVMAAAVAGATVNLRRPLTLDHINAATVQGTTCTYAVTSSQANAMFWDGHAEWNINNGQYLRMTALECTKYPLVDLTGDQDLFDIDSQLAEKLDKNIDLPSSRAKAAQDLFSKIGRKDRARVFADSGHSFRRAIAYQWFINFYRPKEGDEAREMRRTYEEALDSALIDLGIVPRDTDQDGIVEADERISWGSVRMVRG